ncbi:MAG: hypothetical protein HZC16_01220, partial [Candidatus Omnitrophica bacterium]|nr:hypothetical protein [Candidatus Omnitrophota bacterium]
TINPFDETETKEMIEFRLKQAGYPNQNSLFSQQAIRLIYQYSQGYPRKITMLCHDALESITMQETNYVSPEIVEELIAGRKDYEE